jgi:hypothetical protein
MPYCSVRKSRGRTNQRPGPDRRNSASRGETLRAHYPAPGNRLLRLVAVLGQGLIAAKFARTPTRVSHV